MPAEPTTPDEIVAELLPEKLRRILAQQAAEDDGLAMQSEDPAIAADHRRSIALARRRAQLARTLEPYQALATAAQGIVDLAALAAAGGAEMKA
ncbi:MAG: hypothetical protein ACO3IB_15150, partial [Phycisphaerales bacterium]